VPLTAGTTYGSGATGSVTVTNLNNCGSQMNGDTATAVIDQLTTVGNQVTSAEVQFTCTAGSGPYLSLYGALAYIAVPTTPFQGYYSCESNGAITGFGNDSYLSYLGDLSINTLNQPVVGMAQTIHGGGYWMVASDGGIFASGDAAFQGSIGSHTLNRPIVGMAATSTGAGYWLVAADGGIFGFNAAYLGSLPEVGVSVGDVAGLSTLTGLRF